jgi:geranylgeranyl pyrophosphate synthase
MSTATSLDVFDLLHRELDEMDARIGETVDIGIPQVNELVRGVITSGGKRIRPTILLLAGRSFAADHRALISAAAGIELLHTASLVHDDDIDHSALRRGRPTLSTQVSSVTAILIGDYLFAQSAILAASTESTRVVSVFASTLADLCKGQIREMLESHRLDQTFAQYEERIYGKTGSLFAGAAEMGAILGGADDGTIAELRAYGRELGIAFQIMDDVLDLREQTGSIGKPAGHDLREGTVTLPIMRYRAGLTPGSPEQALLIAIANGDLTDDEIIDDVVSRIRRSGALDEATEIARDYVEAAKSHLGVVPDLQTQRYLVQIADLVLDRSA